MKRLIAQACAVILCIGMAVPELFALSIGNQGLFQENRQEFLDQPSLPASGSRHSITTAGWRSVEDGVFEWCPYVYTPSPQESGDPFLEKAAEQLFGRGSPGCRLMPCDIDSSTMSITRSYLMYPVKPGASGSITESVMSRIHDASAPAPLQGSLILIGLGLIAVSGFWRRKGNASPESGSGVSRLPVPSALHIPDFLEKGSGARDRSLAA